MFLKLLPGWPLPVIAIALPLFSAFLLGCAILLEMAYTAHTSGPFERKKVYLKVPFLFFLFLNFALNYLVWSYSHNLEQTFFTLGAAGWAETLSGAGGGSWKAFLRLDPLGAMAALLTSFIVLLAGLRSLADKSDPITPNKIFFMLLTQGGVVGIFYSGGITNLFLFLLISQIGATGLYRPVRAAGLKTLNFFSQSAWYYASRVLVMGMYLAGTLLLLSKYKVSGFTQLHAVMQPGALELSAYVLMASSLFFLFIKPSSYITDASKRCYFAMRGYAMFFALLRVNFLLFGPMQGLDRIPWLYILFGGAALWAAFALTTTNRDPIRFTESVELFLKGFITISFGLSLNGTGSAAAAAEYGLGALESMLSLWMLFLPISAALSIIGCLLKQKYAGSELWTLGGLSHKLPFTGFVFFIVICGLAGLPPFPGFISRQFLYRAANAVSPFLTLFLFAMSLAVLFIGIWYISGVLFGKAPDAEEKIQGDAQIALPLFLILIFLLFSSAAPNHYYDNAVSKSVSSLMRISYAAQDEQSQELPDPDDSQDVPDVEPIPGESE